MDKGEAENILARVVGGATHPSYTDIREACRYALDVLNEPSLPSDVEDDLDEIDPKHLVHEKVEEPDKSLEEEVKKYFQGYWPGTETVEQCNTDLHFTSPAIMRLARHFAEWGAEYLRDSTKMIDKSLDEAAEEAATGLNLGSHLRFIKGFKAGAEWQKSQMLKDAVEGKVFMSFTPGHNQMVMADVDLPTNTKVRIVVLKEEEE